MDRQFILFSTLCYLVAVAHTLATLRDGVFRPRRFNFIAIAVGFVFQSAFLSIRGHVLGRCRARLRGGRHVPGPGTPTEDPPVALDLLSSAAPDEFVLGHHALALARICALHGRTAERLFYRRTVAAPEDDLRVRRLDFLW